MRYTLAVGNELVACGRRVVKFVYQEFSLFDDFGNQLVRNFKKVKPRGLGGGWVAIYKKALRKLLWETPNLSTLKVYLHIASKQTYQKLVMITQMQIARDLSMNPATVSGAMKWLISNEYLQKHVVDGNTGWLLNPFITTQGAKSLPSKREIWEAQKQKQAVEEMDIAIEKRKKILVALDSIIAKNLEIDENDVEVGDNEASDARAVRDVGEASAPELDAGLFVDESGSEEN